MTDDNRHQNIAFELECAVDAVRATAALLDLGLHRDAVSRGFYAVHHYLRALLLARGLEAKTHSGGVHLFNVHFVRTGLFDVGHNRVLGTMQRARELADYDAAVPFTEQEARDQLEQARSFGALVEQFLRGEGLIS